MFLISKKSEARVLKKVVLKKIKTSVLEIKCTITNWWWAWLTQNNTKIHVYDGNQTQVTSSRGGHNTTRPAMPDEFSRKVIYI